jgi:glucose/arabinose dehydrogenase
VTWKTHLRNGILIAIAVIIGLAWYLFTPDKARVPLADLQGPKPALQVERPEVFPSIKIADIVGWQGDAKPVAATGLAVKAFADGLDHPRWLHVLPNGDVLVAESTQPARETHGFMDWFARKLITKSNGATVSANRISLLRDTNGDGVADQRSALLSGLNSPYGIQYLNGVLYVANTDSLMAWPFSVGQTKITAKGEKLLDLPANLPNNHWARNVVATPDGERLLVTIGSNSNIGENGMKGEEGRAEIREYTIKTRKSLTYAYGLRNPNGIDFNPVSGTPWTVVNERDMLGSDGPPDYLTTVDFGTFYGWPYSYWGRYVDDRVKQERPDLRQYTKIPDYALGSHVAALGLVFNRGEALGAPFANGAFIGMHGSWNRSPASGYMVAFVPFNERGFPTGAKPRPVLTGFLNAKGDAQGRPAGVAFDKSGALLVADDSGNRIWRVTQSN